MKGCTFKRILPSGRISWGYSVDAGPDAEGRRRQVYRTGFERRKDADDALQELLRERSEGTLVKPDPRTLGNFLDEWLRSHAEKHLEPKTAERYRQLAAYVTPHLGAVPLRNLTTLMLERTYTTIHESGGKAKRRLKAGEKPQAAPLSARTVKHVANTIRAALNTAVRWKLLKVNPAIGCELPKVERREARALSPSETEWFLTGARGTWLYPFLLLEAATGARRGELCALAWGDLVLTSTPPLITILKSLQQTKAGVRVKAPKNGKSRTLPLPGLAVEALRDHRAEQDEWRRTFGPDYRADLNLVFSTPEGNYLKPDTVSAKASALARKLGLKGVSLHTLRHSHGSQLLSAGVPLPAVSKRLGHSSTHVTATVYAHALPADEIAAAEAWDSAMRAVLQPAHTKQ